MQVRSKAVHLHARHASFTSKFSVAIDITLVGMVSGTVLLMQVQLVMEVWQA